MDLSGSKLIQKSAKIINDEGLYEFVCRATNYKIRHAHRLMSTLPLYWRIAPKYYQLIQNFDTDEYNAPLNPYKIEWVNLNNITKTSRRKRPYEDTRYAFGKIKDGDWDIREYRPVGNDQRTVDLKEYPLYQSFQEHFINGVEWKNTKHYNRVIKEINAGRTLWHGCETEQDVMERYSYLDKLFYEIKSNGYKTQEQLPNKRGFKLARKNEIGVDISRNGELLFVDGHHRLFISKVLNIDKIPVVFLVRHKKWMEHRDEVYKTGMSESHPDFSEFE